MASWSRPIWRTCIRSSIRRNWRRISSSPRTHDVMMRNVIFDLDGTLLDSLEGIQWSVEAALAACGMPPVCPGLKPLIGPPIRAILALVTGRNDAAELDRMEQAF